MKYEEATETHKELLLQHLRLVTQHQIGAIENAFGITLDEVLREVPP